MVPMIVKRKTVAYGSVSVVLSALGFFSSALAADQAWKEAMIADAVQAAPPSVTRDATIYGWSSEGAMVLVRYGAGPYTCVASGAFSLRIGKPPLPYPDPMCMDQNAWAFLKSVFSEKSPAHPEEPYPTAPGLVWMLAGMNVAKGAVALGASEVAVLKASEGDAERAVFQMTPHVMIMPVPFDEKAAGLPTAYDLDQPLNPWIMAVGTPIEHLMVHFSPDDVAAMMASGN
jgi:hypothetical protein